MDKQNIPEGWKKIKLKEVLTEVNERNKEQKVKRVLSVTNSQGFVNQEDYFDGAVHSADISNYKIIRKNQFAYNPSRVNVGSIDILKDYDEGALSPMYVVFKVDESKLLPDYFKYYFQTHRFFESVKNNTQGSVRNSLSFKSLINFEYLLPTIEEQIKIIKILNIIDKIIKIQENKSEEVKKEKEYIIGKIFDDNILNIEKKGKIKDIMYFEGGSQPDKKYFSNKKLDQYIRLIQIRDYKTDDYVTYIPEKMARKICKKDDVMIGRYGPPIFQILRGLEGAYNVALIKTIPRENITKDFVYYVLKQEKLFNKIDWLSQRSSGQTGVDMEFLNNYSIIIPTKEEQNKITKIFRIYDNKIFEIEECIKYYGILKKALMQKLLTGKVRVKK